MKRKIALFLAAVVLLGLSACSGADDNVNTSDPALTQSASQSSSAGSFDIETVRKSFIIKGQPFEVPVRIGDLDSGWTYETMKSYFGEGIGLATFFYNETEMFSGATENFYYDENDKDGIIFDIDISTSDCSLDGIIPNVTTKKEVLDKYGEPTEIITFDSSDNKYWYVYGNKLTNTLIRLDHSLLVVFYEDSDVVKLLRVSYSSED